MAKLIELDKVLEILNDAIQESDDFAQDVIYLEWAKADIEKLPTTETGWISVSERLPRVYTDVLCANKKRDTFTKIKKYFQDDNSCFRFHESQLYKIEFEEIS